MCKITQFNFVIFDLNKNIRRLQIHMLNLQLLMHIQNRLNNLLKQFQNMHFMHKTYFPINKTLQISCCTYHLVIIKSFCKQLVIATPVFQTNKQFSLSWISKNLLNRDKIFMFARVNEHFNFILKVVNEKRFVF